MEIIAVCGSVRFKDEMLSYRQEQNAYYSDYAEIISLNHNGVTTFKKERTKERIVGQA